MSKIVRYRVTIKATLTPEEYSKIRETLEEDYSVGYFEGEVTVTGGYKTWEEVWKAIKQFEGIDGASGREIRFTGVNYNVPAETKQEG